MRAALIVRRARTFAGRPFPVKLPFSNASVTVARTFKGTQMAAKKEKPVEFEAALAELEALVERLERGDQPLEEALGQFERGIELTRHCQSALKKAEQRVDMLLKKAGIADVTAFDADE